MRFDQPVGTVSERNRVSWAGGWFDATGFATYYTATGKPAYHTGADLNLPNYADVKAPVYASADGTVVYAGVVAGWPGELVNISHGRVDGKGVWTRSAHLTQLQVSKGQTVKRGQQIGVIGDYPPPGGANDHCHFGVSFKDLGAHPGDWPGMDLAQLLIDYTDPLKWINTHKVEDIPANMKMKVIPTDGLRVRTTPDSSSTWNAIGKLPSGAIVEINEISNGWASMDVVFSGAIAGGVALGASALKLFGYSSAQYLESFVDPPPPPPTSTALHAKYALGVNCLNFAEDGMDALAAGCRTVLFMSSMQGAWDAHKAYPDACVMIRMYLGPDDRPSAAEFVARLGVNPDAGKSCIGDGAYIFTLTNEADYLGWSAGDIEGTCRWHIDAANRIHAIAPFAKVAVGSIYHGGPDWNNAEVMATFNRVMAPFLNANSSWAYFDGHNYTRGKRFPNHPPADAPIIGADWFETRNQRGYVAFGTGGQLNSHVVSTASECGVEAGAGGFSWAGYTPEQFTEWAVWYVNAQRQSVAPVRYGALFQYSRRDDWKGYSMLGYKAALAAMWRNDVPLLRTLQTVAALSAPPPHTVPPRKEMP